MNALKDLLLNHVLTNDYEVFASQHEQQLILHIQRRDESKRHFGIKLITLKEDQDHEGSFGIFE